MNNKVHLAGTASSSGKKVEKQCLAKLKRALVQYVFKSLLQPASSA